MKSEAIGAVVVFLTLIGGVVVLQWVNKVVEKA